MTWHIRDNRSDWVKVLEKMYDMELTADLDEIHNTDRYSRCENPENTDRLLKLAKLNRELSKDIGSDGVENSISYLQSVDIVEKVGPKEEGEYEFGEGSIEYKPTFGLTQEGLQLAHQVKTERQRHYTNILLLILTGVLVVLTIALLFV